MELVVYSKSRPFERHLEGQLDCAFETRSRLQVPCEDAQPTYLLHLPSMKLGGFEWLSKHAPGRAVGVCADIPAVGEMLECVRLGARAYCNSHMAAPHYNQMLRLLGEGQSWFPPRMLDETFRLARDAISPQPSQQILDRLTRREREVALAVSEGKSNREVADHLSISEATVKTHLTNVFKKLNVKDRVSLLLLLKPA